MLHRIASFLWPLRTLILLSDDAKSQKQKMTMHHSQNSSEEERAKMSMLIKKIQITEAWWIFENLLESVDHWSERFRVSLFFLLREVDVANKVEQPTILLSY